MLFEIYSFSSLFVKYTSTMLEKSFILGFFIDNVYMKKVLKMLSSLMGLRLNFLLDMFGIDLLSLVSVGRFLVTYVLQNILKNLSVILWTMLGLYKSTDSITPLFFSAGWLESEVWDMFGMFFDLHMDLRSILTDYGFMGNPLRKDFPVTGFYEISYVDKDKNLLSMLMSLLQELSVSKLLASW